MSDVADRALIIVVVAVTVLLEACAVVLTRGVGSVALAAILAVYACIQVGAGGLVVWRYPRHRVGWLLVLSALFNAVVGDLLQAYGEQGAHHGWPGADLAQVLGLSSWIVAALGLTLLFLWFPDGPVSGRARLIVWLWAIGAAFALPGWMLNPRLGSLLVAGVNPYAVGAGVSQALYLGGFMLVVAALVGSVGTFIVRFWRSRGVERLQLKWMAFAASVVAVVLPMAPVLWTVWPPIQLVTGIALCLLPIAASIAILRYHLYDIDLVVSRTVSYAAVTGVLAAAYATVVILLSAVVSTPVPAAVAALCVAVAFRPIRDRIQGAVDRRFRRARYETVRVMSDYVDGLRRGTAGIDDLERTLREAVDDPGCRVLFEQDGGWYDVEGRPVGWMPTPGLVASRVETGARVTPVVVHDECKDRRLAEALDAGRLAFQIGALQVDLRRQLEELDASRARVVAAADQERRRIARDLHDGAQQRLVTIGLTLRHFQHELNGSWPALHAELDTAVGEIGHAIEDLRHLAGGLRPTSLDHGLRAALTDWATRTPGHVFVDVTSDRFSPEIETAAYFIAAEGLTNAVKHAHAGRIDLAVAREDGQLVVAVDDDGEGGADPLRGTGLRGLADRARSHGGTIEISSTLGSGTSLRVRLPCA